MSLSAVATNGPIEEGGTYYLISRALGPKLGGSVGIMYYLGVSLLAVLESLGAVEMFLFTFPGTEFTSANRVIAAMILLILCFLVYFGISFVSKLSLVFFAVVIYTMLSYYLGLFTAPRKNAPSNLTGLKWATFTGNWDPDYDQGVSFPVALAIFFPCFTGILSGADRAKNLAYPERSIPAGTIGAVTISLVMYLSYMGFWSAVGTRDYLLGRKADGAHRGHGENLEVVTDVAFPLAILTQLGIIIASMAQAFQCLITSPRLLQAIASDGVIPFLRRFAKTSKNGEPRSALLATTVLCVLAAMIGSLDAVAPLVSICFLTAYSALNFSCFVLSILGGPSWRPKWKFYHWSAALVGFLLCFAVSFVVKYYWAIVAVVIQILIYLYIDYRQVEVDWGTGLGGLRLQVAVQSILSVGHEARYTVNWRPQLLCLCKPRSARSPDDHSNLEFMLFVSQLKKGRGLCVMATILEGTLEAMAPQVEAERLEIQNTMEAASVTGFARVLVASSYKDGKSYAIQSSGLGALEPNTLVLGWPNKWSEEEHHLSAKIMLEILDECKAVDKAILLCMNLDEFPTAGIQQEGYIDVWWIVHDGGLLLILAHLLKQHKIWRKCKLRVHTVSEQMHDPLIVKKNLKMLLDRIRIEAEVQVFDMDTGGLAPYTYDTTIRIEEARAFAEEVVLYRLAQEQQKKTDQGKQPFIKPPEKQGYDDHETVLEATTLPTVKRSNSGNRQTLEDIFKDVPTHDTKPLSVHGRHIHENGDPSKVDNQGNAGSKRIEQSKRWTSGIHERLEAIKHETTRLGWNLDPSPSLAKSQTVEHILKRTVPAELSVLEGFPHQPRPRSDPLYALKPQLGLHNANKLSCDTDSCSPTGRKMMIDDKSVSPRHEKWEEGYRDAALVQSSSTLNANSMTRGTDDWTQKSDLKGESTSSAAEKNEQKDGKETTWADDYGHDLEEGNMGEISVEEMGAENDDETELREGGLQMVRTGSAGQLYPGSPHNSDFGGGAVSQDFPQALIRTWETFSQNYSPNKLNDIISDVSKDAQLVLLNLPDHYQGMEPARYMEYCEEVTRGLRRVLLVHGTGKEMWNAGQL